MGAFDHYRANQSHRYVQAWQDEATVFLFVQDTTEEVTKKKRNETIAASAVRVSRS